MATPSTPPPGSTPPPRNKPTLSGPIAEPTATKPQPPTKQLSTPPPPRPLASTGAPREAPLPDSPEPPPAKAVTTTPPLDALARAKAVYDQVFPVGAPHRKYGPAVIVGLVLVVLLLARCAVSSAGGKISAVSAERAEAKRLQSTGVLLVKSNRPDAIVEAKRIVAAGEPAAASVQGPLGQTLPYLEPGKYTVTVHAAGWPDAKGEIEVRAGQTTETSVNFTGGSLRLVSEPAGATVKMGSEILGKTPLVIPLLPPGEVPLTLEYPSWPALPFKATITENQESSATARLPHGKVVLDTFPSGATVLQGRTALGKTPLTLERVPAGSRKYTFQMKGFPTVDVALAVTDGKETNYAPALGSFFPALDPAQLLRDVWIAEDRSKITTGFNATTGIYRPRNDVVKNLHRESLYNRWLNKPYTFSGVVKSYDAASGRVEFSEQKSDLSRYRLIAEVPPGTKLAAPVTKDSTLTIYGTLTAVEEPAWPGRVITLEVTSGDFLPDAAK